MQAMGAASRVPQNDGGLDCTGRLNGMPVINASKRKSFLAVQLIEDVSIFRS